MLFPSVLTLMAVGLAFIGGDTESSTKLSSNTYYVLGVVLAVFWAVTLINFLGVRATSWISSYGVILGTLVPAFTLMGVAIAYLATGHPSQMPLAPINLLPKFHNIHDVVLAITVFVFYAGIEMSSVHIKDLADPQKNYPISIFTAIIFVVIVLSFGTLSISLMIPADKINLTQSLLVSYHYAFGLFDNTGWIASVMSGLVALGALAMVSTWVAGPSRGILAVAKAGYLPVWMQKTNKHGVQVNILLMQAGIVTVLSVLAGPVATLAAGSGTEQPAGLSLL